VQLPVNDHRSCNKDYGNAKLAHDESFAQPLATSGVFEKTLQHSNRLVTGKNQCRIYSRKKGAGS
jgi:hypothetical protein